MGAETGGTEQPQILRANKRENYELSWMTMEEFICTIIL
jgi:hypothetical protein